MIFRLPAEENVFIFGIEDEVVSIYKRVNALGVTSVSYEELRGFRSWRRRRTNGGLKIHHGTQYGRYNLIKIILVKHQVFVPRSKPNPSIMTKI